MQALRFSSRICPDWCTERFWNRPSRARPHLDQSVLTKNASKRDALSRPLVVHVDADLLASKVLMYLQYEFSEELKKSFSVLFKSRGMEGRQGQGHPGDRRSHPAWHHVSGVISWSYTSRFYMQPWPNVPDAFLNLTMCLNFTKHCRPFPEPDVFFVFCFNPWP